MDIDPDNIPGELKQLDQWVLWREEKRSPGDDKPTKVLYRINSARAKSNDRQTWSSFDLTWAAYLRRQDHWSGIGFVFSPEDPYCGIDLDGCRHPETGQIAAWACRVLDLVDSYAEISPSGTGVKIISRGRMEDGWRHKIILDGEMMLSEKQPAIEVYDRGRFFTVTGQFAGSWAAIAQVPEIFFERFKSQPGGQKVSPGTDTPEAVLSRARKYLERVPPAVSGQGGHNATFKAACILILGFQLTKNEGFLVLKDWNQYCQPPWTDQELWHKIRDADKQPGQRGWLRNTPPGQWDLIQVPQYELPRDQRARSDPKAAPLDSLWDLALRYAESLKVPQASRLVSCGFRPLDEAVGGGFDWGEMVVVAARPGQGKSAWALQVVHHVSLDEGPVLILSEEMSGLALGKRVCHFASKIPQESWPANTDDLILDVERHQERRYPVYVVQAVTLPRAQEVVERCVAEHGIKFLVIDYTQLLQARADNMCQEVSQVSKAIRRWTSKHGLITLALCQLNREVERRTSYVPVMRDLRESGQIEQDADVIVFLVWRHRVDPSEDPYRYQMFVAKVRNRPMVKSLVECYFNPARQMVSRDKPNANLEFTVFDQSNDRLP